MSVGTLPRPYQVREGVIKEMRDALWQQTLRRLPAPTAGQIEVLRHNEPLRARVARDFGGWDRLVDWLRLAGGGDGESVKWE